MRVGHQIGKFFFRRNGLSQFPKMAGSYTFMLLSVMGSDDLALTLSVRSSDKTFFTPAWFNNNLRKRLQLALWTKLNERL